MIGKPNWRDYIIALLIVSLIPVCLFQIKLNISTNLTLYGFSLAFGGLAGVIIGIICFRLKKSKTLVYIAVLLSILWFIIPEDTYLASALFSCSSVCYIGLFPHLALLFTSFSKKKKVQ